MAREEWSAITVRVPSKLKEQLREYVAKLGYMDVSEWVRDVIRYALQVPPVPPEYLTSPLPRQRKIFIPQHDKGSTVEK